MKTEAIKKLIKRCKAQEKLLIAYRLGRRPPETALNALQDTKGCEDAARAELDAIEKELQAVKDANQGMVEGIKDGSAYERAAFERCAEIARNQKLAFLGGRSPVIYDTACDEIAAAIRREMESK